MNVCYKKKSTFILKVKPDHRKVPKRFSLKGNSVSPIHYAQTG